MNREDVMRMAMRAGLLDRVDCSNDYFIPADAFIDEMEKLANLAYEAGRKDENEACANLVNALRRMKLEKGFVCDCGIEDATWDLIEAVQEKTDDSH